MAATAASGSGAAPHSLRGAVPDFIDRLAEQRHEALFEDDRLGIPKAPEGFRAEDVLSSPDLEGFVSLAECSKRMEVSEERVLELARSGYLLARWNRGHLLIRPGVL
jgi:hypothetical protein